MIRSLPFSTAAPTSHPDRPLTTAAHPRVHASTALGLAHAAVLALLYAAPALIAARMAWVTDPDIWWHLRSAEWIVHHHAFPHVDSFSATAAGSPWQAYSWLFELLVFSLVRALGSFGIVVYTSGMLLLLAAALHRLARRLQPDAVFAILLTALACLSIGRLFTPRPWLLSIVFFILELDLLLGARRSGRAAALAWLPLLFALWANVHIQFVDGLIVLALAAAASLFEKKPGTPRLAFPWLIGALLASLAATLLNPYGWHLYQTAWSLATEHGVFNTLAELQAMPFRDWWDFSLLLLTLASAAALGRPHPHRIFHWALLLFASLSAFRSQRDVWLLAVVTVAILASSIRLHPTAPPAPPRWAAGLGLLGAFALSALGLYTLCPRNPQLQLRIQATFPATALAAVKAAHLPGPLFSTYEWGGYLIWQLPQLPVNIDGRAQLHGDARIEASRQTWMGAPGWSSDPALRAANLILAPRALPLTQLLRLQPRYQVFFEDSVTVVFVVRDRRQELVSSLVPPAYGPPLSDRSR